MNILSEKYGIPEDTVKKLMKDGIISCKWSAYDQVAKLKREGKSVNQIADETNYSEGEIYRIFKRLT